MANGTALSLSMSLENNALCHDTVHKTWGMITLQTNPLNQQANVSLPADFVVAIDVSASVQGVSKLLFLNAIVNYLLSKLDENQTFTLIAFNHDVQVLAELRPCTPSNKLIISSLVQQLNPCGSTNLANALFCGTTILNKRPSFNKSRISSLMLFTDDLSNRGLSTSDALRSFDMISLPPGCVFHTFGFGPDHDSKLLHAIALKAQGLYFYLERKEDIPATVGECVAGLLSTRAHQINVRLVAQDGARVVTLATPFKITETQVAKDYGVKLELLYSGETKSILFRLSLRAMQQAMTSHHLVYAEVNYVNTLTMKSEILMANCSVIRPAFVLHENIPIPLDQHINRYSAATTITEAIELSKKYEFMLAQLKLKHMVEQIESSASASTPYCQDLAMDLRECQKGMTDASAFQTGMHFAHSCSSMYFMERSTGLDRFHNLFQQRHVGYGYTTTRATAATNCLQQSHFASAYSNQTHQDQGWNNDVDVA